MIICDNLKFAFIHIPKCAGSSFRRSLRPIDTSGEAFFQIADHPVMGRVHLAHLTLADIASHYPSTFEKLERYSTMAMVRHPTERFYSAIFQRLREFKGVAQSHITTELIEAEAKAVIQRLERKSDRLDVEHVHFTPQVDFLELGGKRMITDIFPVSRVSQAAEHVQSVTGIRIGSERRNQTTELRFAMLRPVQRALRDHYARLLPAAYRTKIREHLTRAGLYREVPKQKISEQVGWVEGFIRTYYARDFSLLSEIEDQHILPA